MPTISPASTCEVDAVDCDERAPRRRCRTSTRQSRRDRRRSRRPTSCASASDRARRASPSPIRLNASTVIRIAKPGKRHDPRRALDELRAPTRASSPIRASAAARRGRGSRARAASRIAVEKPSVACTISGAAQFGRIVLNISRSVPAPAMRDDVTYSRAGLADHRARVRRT